MRGHGTEHGLVRMRGIAPFLVYNFNHNFQKINLDSSFGFSRRAAEAAECAEKVPKTGTSIPRTHVTTENGFTQMLKA